MAEEIKPTLALKECNICGSEIEENTEYCPECGADFTEDFKYNY
ncbi:MAG: zinc-ribbon domain-containing protein [Candidatus Woesearchaeota archaeon]